MLNPVPQAVQSLGQTQAPILANFTTIDTAFTVNHMPYNGPDQGKHKFIQFPQQGGDPGTGPTEVALVAKVGTAGTQLFFQPAGGGASIEFTYALQATTGWTRLPSGIYLQWGVQNFNNNTLFTFPKPMTHTYSIQLTSLSPTPSLVAYTVESQVDGTSFNASSRAVGGTNGFVVSSASILVIGV